MTPTDSTGGLSEPAATQYDALVRLNDELMSMLHAHPLREERVASATVREWLRVLVGIVEDGLGKNRSPD